MKDPCHYFLPSAGVDTQQARARRTRWCNETVGPQREHKWKGLGKLCIDSIKRRIWRT